MSEFILPTNQKILWDTLQKHPYCSTVFPPGSEENKINWFKNIISETYYSIQGKTLIRTQLIEINKNILKRMIHELKEIIDRRSGIIQMSNQSINLIKEKQLPIQTETIYSRESILENKTTEFQNNLERRQREYGDLFQKPTPPIVEFEQATDSVIYNMDELIQQQLKERENDLKQITNSIKPLTIQIPVKPSIEIKEEIELEESINIIPSIKKHVSWDLPDQTESIQIKLEIDELKKKYAKLIDFLEDKIPDFKNQFSQFDISNSEF